MWVFFFSSRRRHTRYWRDWSSDVCSSDLVQAAAVLSLVSGIFLAFLARFLCGLLGVPTELGVLDYVVISTVGGILAGVLLLGITVLVARLSVARGWDMDNIAAPMLTAAGDILTLPALVLTTYLIGIPIFSDVLAAALVVVTADVVRGAIPLGGVGITRSPARGSPTSDPCLSRET